MWDQKLGEENIGQEFRLKSLEAIKKMIWWVKTRKRFL